MGLVRTAADGRSGWGSVRAQAVRGCGGVEGVLDVFGSVARVVTNVRSQLAAKAGVPQAGLVRSRAGGVQTCCNHCSASRLVQACVT